MSEPATLPAVTPAGAPRAIAIARLPEQGMIMLRADLGAPLTLLDDGGPGGHFLLSRQDFADWARGRKQLRMDQFYAWMRKRTGLLMDAEGRPEGGKFSFDADNRKHAKGIAPPARPGTPPDALTQEVIEEVEAALKGMLKYEDAQTDFANNMSANDSKHELLRRQLSINQLQPETPIDGRLALKFDSNFESGNLDLAALTNTHRNDEYDLLIRLDSNSRTHQQWYYFSVDARSRGAYRECKVRLNILNFTKPRSMYQQGMRPLVWSQKLYQDKGIGWHPGGEDIQYHRSRLKRYNYRNPC